MSNSNFPEFHGIALAAGAYIENVHFERLTSDPVPVAAGRKWFNVTEKRFKFSSLDAQGAVIVLGEASIEELNAAVSALNTAIASEASARAAADGTLTTNLAAEVSRAEAAEGVLTTNLAAEVSRAEGAEATLQTNITNEASARSAADQALGLRIDALGNVFSYIATVAGGVDQASAFDLATLTLKNAGDYYKVATSGWFVLGAGTPFHSNLGDGLVFNLASGVDVIDNTNSQVTGVVDYIAVTGSTENGFVIDVDTVFKGRVSTLESGLAAEITRATGAESTLTTNLAAEVTARAAADSAIQTELDATQAGAGLGTDGAYGANATANYIAAATSLADADNKLDAAVKTVSNAVASEATRAQSAEATLTTNLANEVTRAQSAEGTLTTNLASEVTRATAAEATLQANIDALASSGGSAVTAEAAARAAADAQIRTDYNARNFTFASAAPALTHVITHGLNSAFVDFTVLVKRDSGLFRNDVVSVEETDSNTLTVYLSTAKDIKASIRSLAAL